MLSCNAMKPGWRFAKKDDVRLADSILFIEAFGSMTGESVIDAVEQDLYSVALSRAELMGWFLDNDRPSLWNQHEAELLNGSSRLGFVQVGVEQPGLPIPRVLPAALQCVGDSIGRFGGTVTGFQVTADDLVNLSDRDCSWYLHGGLTWFDLKVQESIEAVVHLDQSLLGEYDVSTLIACIKQTDLGKFEMLDEVPESARIRLDSAISHHSRLQSTIPHPKQGILVAMPEWSASIAGWVLARVIDGAHKLGSKPPNYIARISRTPT